jgi:hypothetical protein
VLTLRTANARHGQIGILYFAWLTRDGKRKSAVGYGPRYRLAQVSEPRRAEPRTDRFRPMDGITLAFVPLLEQLSAQSGKFQGRAPECHAATVHLS